MGFSEGGPTYATPIGVHPASSFQTFIMSLGFCFCFLLCYASGWLLLGLLVLIGIADTNWHILLYYSYFTMATSGARCVGRQVPKEQQWGFICLKVFLYQNNYRRHEKFRDWVEGEKLAGPFFLPAQMMGHEFPLDHRRPISMPVISAYYWTKRSFFTFPPRVLCIPP